MLGLSNEPYKAHFTTQPQQSKRRSIYLLVPVTHRSRVTPLALISEKIQVACARVLAGSHSHPILRQLRSRGRKWAVNER